ncbi:Hypothetical protein CINCED_3A003356 [Cinara cedri]|uniref:Uncharacterized protein n=1 Tax=Cinara cedri TaxID=506608 RepID=A0A5E4MJ02_9HEMI|nr:Hypothetical protein CINCED_3A003356 [Cinara cedri]
MQTDSDFESGNLFNNSVLDLECSQVFRPTQALCDFLEKTEAELKNDKKKKKEVYPGNDEPSQRRDRTERELNTAKFEISLY